MEPSPHTHKRALAALIAAVAIGGGSYGIVDATAGNASGTAATATQPAAGGGGSNARSGPAAGGSVGTVESVSPTSFTISTAAGQTVTVEQASSTSARAVKKGERVLVLGTTSGTTITAARVIVQPAAGSALASAATVVPFQRGAASTSKQAGQIPASYSQGTGTIVGGTAANRATEAALAAYPGVVVDRVVKLANGEYEVHNIGVNWPHHIFVNQNFEVVGAD